MIHTRPLHSPNQRARRPGSSGSKPVRHNRGEQAQEEEEEEGREASHLAWSPLVAPRPASKVRA